MSTSNRNDAVMAVASVVPPELMAAVPASISNYGEDVFNAESMREYLSKSVCEKLLATINKGTTLDPEIAADVAHGMKHWAIERGATHFTHWFLPLTGATAEKHDSFLEPQDGKAILAFSGKNLIVGEPDASSFPSGGLRSTFEARGYTAWDPTSPAFIKRHGNGATLCIPTAFCSYTGEALDKKTPLLRSMQALSASAKRLMACFGLPEEKVEITLGAEQEYFLIDKKFYLQRPDLIQTGRTVFGAAPAKHQQLEDHYFGSIRMRILNFMNEVEKELWSLGIPAKTRHNEVAPAQFELAPMFEEVNLASDHNMLVMEVLRHVADRHGFVCLLHEKPFAGINGSGKHNNWAVSYGKRNLLNPGNDPHSNAIFMTVLCAIIEAVDKHSDILRSTVTGVGNDHRLGANEAPPAIVSIYLGDQLADVISQLEKGAATSSRHPMAMRIGVDTLPVLPKDATDRNRTSPFAFTGNKFEFRAPGSSQSCSGPNVVLNTIVAEAFDRISAELEKLSADQFQDGLQDILHNIVKTHKRIIFNGNGYSDEWVKEAEKRGLPNAKTTPDAIKCLLDDDSVEVFKKYGVFSKSELDSRYEVFMEDYTRKIYIEGGIAMEIAESMIIPAVAAEYGRIAVTMSSAKNAGLTKGMTAMAVLADKLGTGLEELQAKSAKLQEVMDGSCADVIAAMADLRESVDALEAVVSDSAWPLPKYREMLFVY